MRPAAPASIFTPTNRWRHSGAAEISLTHRRANSVTEQLFRDERELIAVLRDPLLRDTCPMGTQTHGFLEVEFDGGAAERVRVAI